MSDQTDNPNFLESLSIVLEAFFNMTLCNKHSSKSQLIPTYNLHFAYELDSI